jgi:hypothetical protein
MQPLASTVEITFAHHVLEQVAHRIESWERHPIQSHRDVVAPKGAVRWR